MLRPLTETVIWPKALQRKKWQPEQQQQQEQDSVEDSSQAVVKAAPASEEDDAEGDDGGETDDMSQLVGELMCSGPGRLACHHGAGGRQTSSLNLDHVAKDLTREATR